MITVAAVGDVHFGTDSPGLLRPHAERAAAEADAFLLAGDLTTCGHPDEARLLAGELSGIDVPMIAVLGNHDYHADRQVEIARVLQAAGITVLEGDTAVIETATCTLGIAGVKGFGGGFAGASGTEFGEAEMKAFVRHTRTLATSLEQALLGLDTDLKVALLHYSPVKTTLVGERLEIYPFLGSYLLAEAADRGGADLVLHGHAHRGTEKGITPGGAHVRNVAQPVIGSAIRLYRLAPKPTPRAARATSTSVDYLEP